MPNWKDSDDAGGQKRGADGQIYDSPVDVANESRQQIEEWPTDASEQHQQDAVEATVGVEIGEVKHHVWSVVFGRFLVGRFSAEKMKGVKLWS